MIIASRTDIGRVRQVNEDSHWAVQLPSGIVAAVVADGMGGHLAGEVASRMTVDSLQASISNAAAGMTDEECEAMLQSAVKQANEVVYTTASSNEQYSNMGTTVIITLVEGERAVIAHVGDSRVYKANAEGLVQLTDDHTLVNELVKSGQITPEEAAVHPRRNVIMRAVGTDPEVSADVSVYSFAPSDILLLCSDGLTDMVGHDLMLETLRTETLDLDGKAERLVSLALHAGGDDNITVVLLQGDANRIEGSVEH
ncbi:protein phosphatase [Paenibacillus cellulosilyticus]|uniref:Protein phosphatase n=1 Tax=Paenibacillus cellulosilyticus TaxID=375489 RepID=A0A2V2YXP2_9BACL|nr:Stp1/IreP family PP2C-type Ser/Thr phosphatase [Paenibacillus cellulosilyticus]PWW06216.1 protein phosphatase [Paenibacillus cellulosilyticus]QKS43022.1 Stp1/IreP family PP2C-type Ser/Thr phosphatase [Paenibacillus cellulosilyticus]